MTPASLHQRFAQSVARFPEHVALEFEGESLTYRELGSLCEGLAQRITDHAGGIPRRIGLHAGRSLLAYAGYLAAQRAGATVVPLSPRVPAIRNATIAESAELDVVLAEDAAAVAALGLPCLAPTPDELKAMIASDTPLAADAVRDVPLAYILFTSGSTGAPKGVPIRQDNVAPYLDHVIARYEVGPGSRLSQNFELTFDLSVFDLYVAWGSGGTLVAPTYRDMLSITGFVRRKELTHWFSVPSVVSYAARRGALVDDAMPSLLWSLFCGEPLTVEQAATWRRAAPRSTLENLYGPTELTISCLQYRLPSEDEPLPQGHSSVPIGTAYPGVEQLVVDERGMPSTVGELCVRGAQRFGGYLDPRDNVGRFVIQDEHGAARTYDGLGDLTEEHWYRTGDRVRMHQGQWLYLGRMDNQVKIRGHRIELEEVEAVLRDELGVSQAVAVAVPDEHGDLQLECVLPGSKGDPIKALNRLRRRLPEYMVPQRVVFSDELPLNANGKIDRRAVAHQLAGESGEMSR